MSVSSATLSAILLAFWAVAALLAGMSLVLWALVLFATALPVWDALKEDMNHD